MIVELFGAPGAGKSTLTRKIVSLYQVKDPMNSYRETFFGKVYMHTFWKTFFFKNELKDKFFEIKELLDVTENNDLETFIKFILFAYYVELKLCTKKETIIIDEGIVHYLIALNAEYGVDLGKIKILEKMLFIPNREVFGLYASEDQIFQNIKKRNRHRTKIDELSITDLYQMIDSYNKSILFFSNYFKVFKADDLLNQITKVVES